MTEIETESVEKAAICYEAGLNEAMLIGTKEELLQLAKVITGLVNESTEVTTYHGVEARQPRSYDSLTDVMADIAIDSLVIVNSKQDRRSLINKIRINSGESPFDWDGYDNSDI